MKCSVYSLNTLKNYKYVVIFARYQNKWIVCKHRERDTWETSGGHIEENETPIEAAKREFFEETGSIDFDIIPVCDYWACDEPHETENIRWSNGQVFLANVRNIGALPENEMECIELFEKFPEKLTYPDITKELLPYIYEKLNYVGDMGNKLIQNHFTATGIVFNEKKQILMIHHKKLNVWLPPGGHIDENELPEKAVLREIYEETGIHAKVLSEQKRLSLQKDLYLELTRPFLVLLEDIEGNGTHNHIDLIYICKAENEMLKMQESEAKDIGWFKNDEVQKLNTFDNVKQSVKRAVEFIGEMVLY